MPGHRSVRNEPDHGRGRGYPSNPVPDEFTLCDHAKFGCIDYAKTLIPANPEPPVVGSDCMRDIIEFVSPKGEMLPALARQFPDHDTARRTSHRQVIRSHGHTPGRDRQRHTPFLGGDEAGKIGLLSTPIPPTRGCAEFTSEPWVMPPIYTRPRIKKLLMLRRPRQNRLFVSGSNYSSLLV